VLPIFPTFKPPIKVVYSWIGPRGPIINTELPNILAYACVAEGAATTSNKFWSDDLWWRVFSQNNNFTLAPTWNINAHDYFIYPYTIGWRVEFRNHFAANAGIFEFSHIPKSIIHHVICNKGYILIDCTAEAWVRPEQLNQMHSYFSHFNRIPMKKIIYLNGCMNSEKLYNEWCDNNGIGADDRMIMIPLPISQSDISRNANSPNLEPDYNTEVVPEKLFLCWNRRFRLHRTMLALGLEKSNLIDRSYYSMGKVDPESLNDFINTPDPHWMERLAIDPLHILKFTQKLPLVLDNETDIVKMCGDHDSAARPFYQNSLVSLITETNFSLPELTLTEKSFKQFKEKHPFIIVGVNGALKSLRELGFMTFSEFWDESYDEEPDAISRLRKIIEVCSEIGSWDNEKILDFKRKVKPIVQHNYNIVKVDLSRKAADTIKNKIKETIK